MTYVTCLYDSFWWVGFLTQVDVEQGDVKVQFMLPHGPRKNLIGQKLKIHAMCQSKTFFVRYLLLPQQLDGRTYKVTDEEYYKTISGCQYLNMEK